MHDENPKTPYQKLFDLASLVPPHLMVYTDEQAPFFVVAVRYAGTPFVTLVKTNHFNALVNGLKMVQTMLQGTDAIIRVERLEMTRDPHDGKCRMQGKFDVVVLDEYAVIARK